jgi:hypothetical protein
MEINHLLCLQDKQLMLEQIWQGIVKEIQKEQITILIHQLQYLDEMHRVKVDRLNN